MGTAVKSTVVPWQTGLLPAEIVIETGNPVPAVITRVLEVAGLLLIHVWFEVNTHFTASPVSG